MHAMTRWMRYTAKEDETRASIAADFGIDEQLLGQYHAEEPTAGSNMRLPLMWRMCPQGLMYPIKTNESLLDVADRFGMTVQQLLCINPAVNPLQVVPGQVLIVRNCAAKAG